MQSERPPSVIAKQLEVQIRAILRNVDINKLDRKPKNFILDLKQVIGDAKTYVNAYELSEMREEQLANAKQAKSFLERARKNLLDASEHDIFSAVDVAHLAAQMELISSSLK